MKIEHTALNVPDPVAMAAWYVEHLGFTVQRTSGPPVHAYFLADSAGTVMIEIYRNDAAPVPDYAAVHPLVLHLAFVSDDVMADRERLLAAGATAEGEIDTPPSGDTLAMLRDPWGIAIQLCQRAEPMI